MPIKLAHDIDWSVQPHCPKCGAGILAYGPREPIAVDDTGRAYCRQHGHLVAPEYTSQFGRYKKMRDARAAILKRAKDAGVVPSAEEMAQVARDLAQVTRDMA